VTAGAAGMRLCCQHSPDSGSNIQQDPAGFGNVVPTLLQQEHQFWLLLNGQCMPNGCVTSFHSGSHPFRLLHASGQSWTFCMEPNTPWGAGGLLLPLRRLAKHAVSLAKTSAVQPNVANVPIQNKLTNRAPHWPTQSAQPLAIISGPMSVQHMHKQNCNTLLSGSERPGQPVTDVTKKEYQI
jgi:hypothetical protein